MGISKIKIVVLSFLLILGGLLSYGQENAENFTIKTLQVKAEKLNNSPRQIKKYINEVFLNQANELVYQNPVRYSAIQSFFNRYFILEKVPVANEKIPKLSKVKINDKYNSYLQHDTDFNALEFNPLKYQLDFFPNTKKMYRIDNTNFVIIILPV
ncbi:hypothetical protein [Pseudofulvibacter geojedonensis]|uniref:Uncharacterized protein n=1 Tax=Pseudofulvibacter geojedonensis TaxID=1123758 RepID=A0ABW3HYM8_9FLAO